jgi:ketosteroid isomerase-like protein
MKTKLTYRFAIIFFLLISVGINAQTSEIPKYKAQDQKLYNEIVKMDQVFFTAYNNCDMKTQSNILSEDLEFFHDKGGLATSKKNILESLEKNICNKVKRTLIKGSIEVYPIHNYGAVQIGYHKFFNKLEPTAKSIPSKFITIWKKEKDSWKITRVVSLHN